jgi:nucleotide-binding universal stress UspA family protein
MRPERILLPIDVTRCPLEVFELVNGFAKRPEVTVILLHVMNPNYAALGKQVGEQRHQDARYYLERLADKHLHPIASTLTHVRAGEPAQQILEEARDERADLIILPTCGPSFWELVTGLWNRPSSPNLSPLAERIIREATCGVFVVLAKTRLNCQKAWERPVKERWAEAASPAQVGAMAHAPAAARRFQPISS